MKLFGYFFRQSCLIVFLFGGIIDAVTADVNVYFLPDDGRCLSNILRNLRAAQQQVTIASYFITNEHIIAQLIELKESKVDIQIIYDSSTAGNEGLTDRLLKAGIIPIVSDFIDEGKMHNKFIVIDDEDVWTGSANLTATSFAQAARAANYENMLKIKSRDIATQYKQNFESIQDDIFKIYVDEFATHPRDRIVAWKRNLIERLSEENNVFRTRLVNTIGSYSRSNIPAKNMLMHNFPNIKPISTIKYSADITTTTILLFIVTICDATISTSICAFICSVIKCYCTIVSATNSIVGNNIIICTISRAITTYRKTKIYFIRK